MLSTHQIQQALELYLKRSYTQCAVLIDGGWGVGKTHLVVNQILPGVNDIHYLHISLYGLASIADIENEIYKSASLNPQTRAAIATDSAQPCVEGGSSASIGGVSYAVQVLVNNFHSTRGRFSKKLVLCFDDLERWAGDPNICLSYINKIVELENIKCVILGNLEVLDERGVRALSQAREKTIRHIYRFENPAASTVDFALQLVDFQSDASRELVNRIILGNLGSLASLMQRVNERNIRTIGEALQLYDYIVDNNIESFERSRGLAFTYFITLLSTLILLKKHFVHKKEREQLFDGNYRDNRGFSLLKKLGYFDEESPEYMTTESRVLLDTIFYRLDEISLDGIFSIIENGFYIENDFVGSFDNWQQDKVYENYLDHYYFYQLDEQDAESLISEIIQALFERRCITNPATLLLLGERLLHDITKKVIDLDFSDTRERFMHLVRELYQSGRMDVINLGYLQVQFDRYVYSEDIYRLILDLNSEYELAEKLKWHRSFWDRLSSQPQTMRDLLDEFDHFIFLKETDDSDHVLGCLEALSNAQLYQFAQLLNEKLEEVEEEPFLERYARHADLIWQALENKYQRSRGIRANNLKEIAEIFRRMSEFAPKRNLFSVLSMKQA